MDRSACPRATVTSCAALKRSIRPDCYVFRKHFSKCSPPSSSGENARIRCQVSGARSREERGTMRRFSLLAVIVLGCALCVLAETKPAADVIIQNARVWTVDSSHPEAEAVAILGDRIVAVGTSAQVDAWRG